MSHGRIVVAILLAALLGPPPSSAQPVPMPEQGLTPYLTPQRVAHLEKGRTINFVCLGEGSPTVPDRAAVDERVAPQFAAVSRIFQEQSVKQRQDCASELRSGTLKSGTPRFERCTATSVPTLFPDLKAKIAQLNADPARLLTQASLEAEHANGNSGRQVVNAKRNYGDMPLIVLTAGRNLESTLANLSNVPPGTPGAGTPEELAQLREQIARFLRDGWGPAHEAYAALSTRGRHQLVDSTHNMTVEKRDVVISAINEVLNASRDRARK